MVLQFSRLDNLVFGNALLLGVTKGDLFKHIVAFSPGYTRLDSPVHSVET